MAARGPPTVHLLALVAVPPGVVTLTGPVVAPVGTVVCIAVGDAVKLATLTPLNATAVAPLKFVPLIVTLVPTAPLVGAKPVIVGGLAPAATVPPPTSEQGLIFPAAAPARARDV